MTIDDDDGGRRIDDDELRLGSAWLEWPPGVFSGFFLFGFSANPREAEMTSPQSLFVLGRRG